MGEVLGLEEGGTWDGDGFVAGGEHRPTVGTAFGDVELFARLEAVEDGEVVDVAVAAVGETETDRHRPP